MKKWPCQWINEGILRAVQQKNRQKKLDIWSNFQHTGVMTKISDRVKTLKRTFWSSRPILGLKSVEIFFVINRCT